MTGKPPGFFDGAEMPAALRGQAPWPDPAGVPTAVGIAADIDPAPLEVARLRLADAGAPDWTFRAGDACRPAVLVCRPVDLVTVEVPPYRDGALFECPAC